MLLHPPGLWPAPQGGDEAHRAHTSTAPWMAQLLPMLWAVGQHCPEPGNPSALQLCPLRALCKASRDTQAGQTAALGMAELGLSQATPVAPHVEPPCSLCTAPQPSDRHPAGQPAWGQLSSAGFVPRALPHAAVWAQTAMNTQLNLSRAICEINIPGAWQTLQKGLYPHPADSPTFHR